MTAVSDLLDGLEAAAKAATPGPWRQSTTWPRWVDDEDEQPLAQAESPADAACIVAEHNAAPLLVAALRAVEAWAAMHDDMARQYEEAGEAVRDPILRDEAYRHAGDCRAIAEGVRNAVARAVDGAR